MEPSDERGGELLGQGRTIRKFVERKIDLGLPEEIAGRGSWAPIVLRC